VVVRAFVQVATYVFSGGHLVVKASLVVKFVFSSHSGGRSGVTVRRFLYGQNRGLPFEPLCVLRNVIGSTAV
jgi:hypothetical protein